MKKFLEYKMLCAKFNVISFVAVCTLATPLHGQVIEEDDGYARSSTDKFFGTAAATVSNGSSHQVSYQALEIGYDTRFARERGRFYFSGIGTNTDVELDLELKDSARRDNQDMLPQTRTREIDEDDFDVRDAFIQYDLTDDLVFSFGRRRVTWGQFDLLSPVNLALPLTPQTAELTSGKIDTMVPQDQVALSWFPGERVEIQAYYFASTQIDWLVEDVLEGDDTETIYNGMVPDEVAADQEDFEDHEHYAARVLFYFDWGTLGLTYHDGQDSLAFNSDLATLECNDASPGAGGCDLAQAINVRRHTDLPDAESYGLELAIPAGKWVYKFEVLHQETVTDLEGFSIRGDAAGGVRNYLNRVITDNGGRLYLPVDRTYFAIGADSDRDNWRFNLSLVGLSESYDDDDLIDAEEAEFDRDRGSVVFPAVNIARYIGGDKQKELGFIGGFLGPYAGASIYYKSHIGDDFRWIIGVEAVRSLRDDLLSESNADDQPNNDRYELADDLSAGVRVSLIYDF